MDSTVVATPNVRSCDGQKVALQIVPLQQGRVSGDVVLLGAENIGSGSGGDRSEASSVDAARRWVRCRASVSGGPQGWRDAVSHARARCLGVICPSWSGRRSRSCSLVFRGARDRASAGRAPSTISGSCNGTLRSVAAGLSIGPRPHRRMPTVALDDRSREAGCQPAVRRYVQDRSPGLCSGPRGASRVRRSAGRGGARRRKDRRWGQCWSSERIARRRRVDFPIRVDGVSHEAIYQSLYVQGRGALRRELAACLRTGRRSGTRNRTSRGNRSFVTGTRTS